MLERMWGKGNPLALFWECELVQPLWKTVWRFLKEFKIDLPYDPAIELLGIYPKDSDAMKRRDTCIPMFLAAMSTIAKLWKEPWCPSKDEWIKTMWFIYTMEYYSAIRNNKYPPDASTWMDLVGSKSIGEGQTLYGLIHLGNIKNSERE